MSSPLNRTSRGTEIRFGRLTEFGFRLGTLETVKVLVTGGGGFIGSHVVDRLLADGHDVRVLDNFATGRRENLLDVLDGHRAGRGRHPELRARPQRRGGCEVVLHQARAAVGAALGPGPAHEQRHERDGHAERAARCARLGRAAGRVRVVVLGLRREPGAAKHEGLLPQPISPYAVAKLAGEGFCRSFHEVFGLETVALRYFNVFGPRQDPLSQYSAVVPNFITALIERRAARRLRRRRAVARLHLRRQRRRRRTCSR